MDKAQNRFSCGNLWQAGAYVCSGLVQAWFINTTRQVLYRNYLYTRCFERFDFMLLNVRPKCDDVIFQPKTIFQPKKTRYMYLIKKNRTINHALISVVTYRPMTLV